VSTKSSKLLITLLSFVVVTAAKAAPTMSDCNRDFVACTLSASSDAHSRSVFKANQVTELCDSHLAAIAAEFQKPPVSFMNLPAGGVGAESLPPVPGALLMVLTGFLCVSLVKDYRIWLAALAGLLWVSQSGIQALPQLATHLGSKKHIQRESPTVCLHQFENAGRLRSDIEGTQYIGLLHRLAGIPYSKDVSQLCFRSGHSPTSMRNEERLRVRQFAILSFSLYLIQSINCSASRAERSVCFSQALIFAQLPRGPPMPTCENL
jgi:hypothetical protein